MKHRKRLAAMVVLAGVLGGSGLAMAQDAATPAQSTRPVMVPVAEAVLGPAPKAWQAGTAVTTIAFGSCIRQDRPQPIWGTINAEKPDVFVFLGDNIYGDSEDMGIIRAKYAQLLAAPGFRELRLQSLCLATWDDHDFGENDAGVEFEPKRESQEQFHNFWGTAAESPLRKQEGVYSAQVLGPVGKRVQVILLDTRYFRSPLTAGERTSFGRYAASDDASTTVLGAAQWAWLEEQLKVPAEVRLVGSSIQVLADGHRFEKWGNFPHERTRLVNLLDKASGAVVVLSGDRHSGEFSTMKTPGGRELFDLTSSALNQGTGRGDPNAEPNPLRSGNRINVPHYGLITFDWAGGKVKMELKNAGKETLVTGERSIGALSAGK